MTAIAYTPSTAVPSPLGEGMVPANFPKYRAGIAAVRTGAADCKMLHVGDSITWGSLGGGNPPGPAGSSYPSRLQAMLNSYEAPAAIGMSIIEIGNSDTRWVKAANWVQNFFGFAGQCAFQSGVSAGALTYSPGVNSDTIDIYYVRGPGFGTFGFSLDGGADALVDTNGASSIQRLTVGPFGTALHTHTIRNITIAGVAIIGMEAYLSTARSIRVGNAGAPGTKLSNYVDATGVSTTQAVASITAYAPHLTVLMTGTNDIVAGTPVATFASQLATFCALMRAIGSDLVLVSAVQPQTGGGAGYVAAMQAAARQNNAGYVDVYNRWTPVATYVGAGFYADVNHPSALGYADVAQAIFQALTLVT